MSIFALLLPLRLNGRDNIDILETQEPCYVALHGGLNPCNRLSAVRLWLSQESNIYCDCKQPAGVVRVTVPYGEGLGARPKTRRCPQPVGDLERHWWEALVGSH